MDTLRLFWKLKLVSTKDPEAIAATKYPLVLVLGEPAVEHRIRGTIQALFEEDGVLGVMPADLEDGTQLLCVGFADQTAAHQSRSDEMKDLYTHLQGIRLDPTTPNGHKILFHDHKDMQEREKFAFDFIDTNHDGKIDEHELQYVLQDSERARQYLEKYHRTADGSISLEDAKYTHGVLEVCQTYGMIVRAFVRHDRAQRDHLYQAWMTEKSAAYGHMPRPGVLNYCGPELAVYFEFLAFYLNYLYVPAAIGIVVYGYNYAYPEPDQVLNPVGVVSFGLFCLVWASVFLCQWGIRLTSLLHTWRVLATAFKATKSNPETFEHSVTEIIQRSKQRKQGEVHYAVRWLRKFGTTAASVAMVSVVVYADFQILRWKDAVELWAADQSGIWAFACKKMPDVTKAFAMVCFDEVFKTVTNVLVRFESLAYESEREDSSMIKRCMFQFASKFLFLYYYAFVAQDFVRLQKSLLTVLFASIVIQNGKELLLPLLKERWRYVRFFQKLKRTTDDPSFGAGDELRLSELREDFDFECYQGTFEDYIELFLQFGQVILFAPVFPLGPLLAVVNNVVEIRGDAYKLLYEENLPLTREGRWDAKTGKGSLDINVWMSALTVLSYLAVVTTMGLLAVDMNPREDGYQHWLVGQHPWITTLFDVVLVLVAAEHVVFVAKGWISYMLPASKGAAHLEQKYFVQWTDSMMWPATKTKGPSGRSTGNRRSRSRPVRSKANKLE